MKNSASRINPSTSPEYLRNLLLVELGTPPDNACWKNQLPLWKGHKFIRSGNNPPTREIFSWLS